MFKVLISHIAQYKLLSIEPQNTLILYHSGSMSSARGHFVTARSIIIDFNLKVKDDS